MRLAPIRRSLLDWYAVAHRDFPWRRTSDPYAVLVSEVMLQQTQASRVAERFPRFMDRFPTAEALAGASDSAVLAEWSGLGYNRRALALQRAAREIVGEGWPRDVAGMQRLPGIGPYTARAVASLAFGQSVGVVDTNVRRWLLRRFAVEDRPATLQALADALAAPGADGSAAAWTHATMEFGAWICTSRAPACGICPIRHGCPSRDRAGRITVPSQPRFAGSTRAARGRLLRALSEAPGHRLAMTAAQELLDGTLDRVIDGLEADGLVHRSGRSLKLGGPGERPVGRPTIGP
jgi:A/G-specific adenine glycosylase